MKTTILSLSVLILLSPAYGQEHSPRERFRVAVAAYQKSDTEENAVKLADLFKKLDPPPAIPAEAEYHAQKGAAFAELAKEPAEFQRAVAEFEKAIQLAPWVGEYHYNTALMLKSKGGVNDLEAALRSIKLARLFAKDDKDQRDATALSAKLEVTLEVTKERGAKEADIAAAKKAEDAAKQATLIVPGQRIGRITVGMAPETPRSILGEPSSTDNIGSWWRFYNWEKAGVRVSIKMSLAAVDSVQVSGPGTQYRTAEGVGVGSLESEIRAKLGTPDRSGKLKIQKVNGTEYLYGYRSGMTLHVEGGKVNFIEVFRPSGFDETYCEARFFE